MDDIYMLSDATIRNRMGNHLKSFRLKQASLNKVFLSRNSMKKKLPYILMLVLSIACLLAFYPTQLRIYLSLLTMGAGGLFYVFWIYYDVKISGEYATLWPTWTSFMPAVAIAMMVAVYRNVMKHGHYFDDIEDV